MWETAESPHKVKLTISWDSVAPEKISCTFDLVALKVICRHSLHFLKIACPFYTAGSRAESIGILGSGSSFSKNLKSRNGLKFTNHLGKSRNGLKFTNHLGNHCLFHD